ncbi:MAG: GAF domain-containing sensor histidine kinase [bacterium]
MNCAPSSTDPLSVALAAAEEMSSHAMQLQEVTALLSLATTELEVAEAVLGKGLGVVGGMRGVMIRVEGQRFELVHARGYQPEMEMALRAIRLDDDTPVGNVVRSGQPLWLESPEEHRAQFPFFYQQIGVSVPDASVSVPLRHAGQVIGALAIVFADSHAFGAVKQAFTLLLAQAAADALSRARSYDAERQARRTAEMLAQARADVLGIVAHDLRNPLGLISSGSSMLLDPDELQPAQRRHMLEIMQRAARRMNRLIGDLLDATQLQAGRLSLDLADVDARRIIREAEETLGPSAAERRVALRSLAPEHELRVHADEGRLLQVIGNLVGNALKFSTAGGSVTLSARSIGVEVIFSVADDGPGIPPDHHAHLFDSFWQARTGDRRGVGLGLSITKDIVGALGGRLWVESTVGVGSTFSFALPSVTRAVVSPRVPTGMSLRGGRVAELV